MKGCIFPGRIISCACAAGLGCTTETDGTAICAVTVRKLASALRRDRMPKNKTANTTTLKIKGVSQRRCDGRPFSGFGLGFGFGSTGTISTVFSVSLISKLVILIPLLQLFGQCSFVPPSVQQAEKCWDEEERRNRSEEKAADH